MYQMLVQNFELLHEILIFLNVECNFELLNFDFFIIG